MYKYYQKEDHYWIFSFNIWKESFESDVVVVEGQAEIDFTAPWSHSNKVLLVEDKKLFVNETILSMSSPVMEAMFTGDFREKGEEEITLPEKTYQDVYELMEVIHPPGKRIDGNDLENEMVVQ